MKYFWTPMLIATMLLMTGRCVEAKQTVYFSGATVHYSQDDRNKEGYMPLIGYSYELAKGDWRFDTGANVFVDSYDQTSASIFSNISHTKYTYKWATPMLMVGVVNKGASYDDDSRQTYPIFMPKLRIGKATGLSVSISAAFEWVGLELGFSW